MKLKTLFAIFVACNFASYGQNVGIGTSSPNALLDVYSTADGILIPRVALTGTASASPLSSPTASTLVYNTATAGSGATAVSPGFYYWSGTAWVRFIDNNSLTGSTTVSNTSTDNTLSTTVNGVTGSTVPLINTNALSQNGSDQLISTINGVGSTPYTVGIAGDVTGNLGASTVGKIQGTPVSISSLTNGNLLQYSSSGTNWVNVTPASILGAATTNSLSLSTNTLTSTVNGVAATSSAVSGVTNTSSANNISTTVNGVTGSTVPIVNSISNTSSANTLSTTVNGVTGSTVPIVNSISNTSSANTLSTTVNGVTGSTAPIINTNVLSQNGSDQLISTINGIGSTPYTVGIAGDVTGNLGASTVTKIQGQSVSATAPSSGQVLEYSSGSWSPTTPGASLFTAGTGLSWSGSTLNSVWATSGSNIYNTNSGYVGIGTSSPGYTLDLNSGTFAFGAGNMRTEVRLDAGLQGNAGAQSGFYQNDGSTVTDYPSGASGWWHMIDCRHSNSANNYAMQFAGSFFDQNLYFRKTNNSPSQAWSRVMTSTDVNGTTNYISKFTSANTIGNSVIVDNGSTVVFSPPTYTYFSTGTVYAQNQLIARGGVYNDGGNLALSASGGAVTVNNQNFDLNSRSAIQDLGDGWERLNQNSSYSNGTYTPGFFRADGGIASGGLGSLGGGTINASGTIATTGSIGVGTTSPSQSIHTTGYVRAAGFQCHNGSSGASYGNIFNFYWSGSSEQAWIDVTDVAGSISDRRLKSDITELKDNGINRVMALRPVSFKFKKIEGTIFTGSPDTIEGFIADEVQQVIPSAVNHKKDELTSEGTIQPQSLNMPPLVSVLTKAIQEQQIEIEDLKKKIEELQKLIEAKYEK